MVLTVPSVNTRKQDNGDEMAEVRLKVARKEKKEEKLYKRRDSHKTKKETGLPKTENTESRRDEISVGKKLKKEMEKRI